MTKDEVLAILKKEGGYVSGAAISRQLGISRAAVNTAVKSLRAQGYQITSATNRGYCLSHSPNCLSAGELLAFLPARRMETVLCLDTVDSTNSRLRQLAIEGAPAGQVVLSNSQTAGRGRRGRTFYSPRDTGLYLSMLLCPSNTPAATAALTAWAAVSVCDAVQEVCGIRPGIKWVNDLVLSSKKMGGILTELSVEAESGHVQYVVVGIGLNVNTMPQDLPAEVRGQATSLAEETGRTIPRAELAAALIRRLDRMREDWPSCMEEYRRAYRTGSITVGREVCVQTAQGVQQGTAEAIQEDFSLLVRRPDGTPMVLNSGEVSVRGLYGYLDGAAR